MKMRVGFAREIITPERGVSLRGYFNARPNRGVLDDTCVRALVLEHGRIRAGIVSFDLCMIDDRFTAELRRQVVAAGLDFADNLIVAATHTHTGGDINGQISATGGIAERRYFVQAVKAGVKAVLRAAADLDTAETLVASEKNNPFGFVRRFWMKNGTVVTNPGKLNPEIDRPESDFDRTVSLLALRRDSGRFAALLVNIANHGDTIGGDLVSGDWYGRMERALQEHFGYDVPVMTLDDASGDVNHFDIGKADAQTSPAEAERIGRGYAGIVAKLAQRLEPLPETGFDVMKTMVPMGYRTVTSEQLAEARRAMAETDGCSGKGDLTSENIVKGDPAVRRIFAQRVLDCESNVSRPPRQCELLALRFGRELAILSLPGEPFNGVARAIRAVSPFKRTLIVELSQSAPGYIPMPECFERGGYETLPQGNGVATDSATRLIAGGTELLNR